MKIINTPVLFLLGVTICQAGNAPAQTAEKDLIQYDVELIIFEDAHARYINSELWPENNKEDENADEQQESLVGQTAEDNNIELISDLDKLSLSEIENIDNTEKTENESLDITDFNDIEPTILINQQNKLNKSSEYNILYYASWRQYGLEESKSFDIDINELSNYHPGTQQKQINTNTGAQQSNNQELEVAENTISGKIKVVLARYLHFYTELTYQRVLDEPLDEKEDTGFDSASLETDENKNTFSVSDTTLENTKPAIAYQVLPITTHRRMRSKELHYIDHPLVGILVQINPVPVVKDETEQ